MRSQLVYDDVVRDTWAELNRLALRLTEDFHGAQDVVQGVFIRAHARWERVSRMDSPIGYLRNSVVNASMDWHRERDRRRSRERRSVWGSRAGVVPDSADEVSAVAQMQAVLATLPPRQRAVLILRYWEDMSEADTAAAMGISVGSVKQHAARGLAHLRKNYPGDEVSGLGDRP